MIAGVVCRSGDCRRELQKVTDGEIAQALKGCEIGEADRRPDAVAFGFLIAGAMLA